MAATPATEQGRETQARILRAAARLIAARGPAGTSLDDVRAATHASKSQIYHYFGDKHGLVEAVVEYQSAAVLGAQARALASVRDWDDLQRWTDGMVAAVDEQGGRGGCPIGTLAAALADSDESLRRALDDAFQTWHGAIRAAIARLRENGVLAADADLDRLSTATLAAVQGGLLLAKTTRDVAPLRIALDAAIAQLRMHAP